MRKWIWPCISVAIVLVIGLLIWQLDFPNWQKLDLEKIRSLPRSSILYDADGNAMGPVYAQQAQEFVPLEEVPAHVAAAFIAAEDQRFYSHHGVDVRRILGALWHDIKTMSLAQGASTITQQLIKLTHLSSEKTLARKLQEAVLAMQLEKRMDKDEILEAYLNVVYFGSGAYGIGAAAQVYFGKDVSELSLAEGALLAGIIKSPSNYAPHLSPENALRRRDYILTAMRDSGAITAEVCAEAIAAPLKIIPRREDSAAGSWYMDQAIAEAEVALGMDAEEIQSAGLNIYTGYRPDWQQAVDALFENGANFPDPAADGTPVQAALVVLDNERGEIAAIAGGREYGVRRGLNRATQIRRQPGSAIKPVSTYAAAIEDAGYLPVSTAQDVQRVFPGGYSPGNAGGKYYGAVTLREALSRSLNVATVDLAERIGMQRVRGAIADFGIELAPQDVNLSLSLGSMTHGVSPARLAAAYCAIANGGTRVEPHALRRITDRRGRVLYEAPNPAERAVTPDTAYLLADMLQTAAASGSARALSAAGIPVLGKTGTVGEEGGGNRDIWTVAAVPEFTAAVWMGFDSPGSGHALPDSAGGSSYPASLCAALFKRMAPTLSGADFKAPDSLVPLRIDRFALERSGEVCLAARNTPEEYIQQEWFRDDNLPAAVSTLWDPPEPVSDLRVRTGEGGQPLLSFTAHSGDADYLILRKSDAGIEVAAVLRAEAGEEMLWTDESADPGQRCRYSVLPRHHLLYESGSLLTGMESAEIEWKPPGLLSRIFGGGA